ncbi:MAG: class I SAM-dependent methyltransferase, partial [Alphaproteobacteria bacterium]|nr:class I SAM-dependent methyltransferase [Alphaproteobacteria bacterium]
MATDVVDLRDFYATPLGQFARRAIHSRIRALWPDLKGQAVAGVGYAVPYLRPYLAEAERVLALMPERQGVLHWPPEGPNVAALVDEAALPLPDLSVDRLMVMHALEHAEQLRPLLREIWRVLAGSGRVLFVVPNRRGLWAQVDRTPFGHGQPYSAGQLSRLLRENLFTPTATAAAVFMLPSQSRLLLSSANACERIGGRWFERFAGVVLVEATKTLYAPTAVRARQAVPLPRPALLPGWRRSTLP